MGLFSKFISPKKSAQPSQTQTVEYNGYQIEPAPEKQNGQYVTAGYICKADESGQLQRQRFIRADTHMDVDAASKHAVIKAKQIIDERGDQIFD